MLNFLQNMLVFTGKQGRIPLDGSTPFRASGFRQTCTSLLSSQKLACLIPFLSRKLRESTYLNGKWGKCFHRVTKGKALLPLVWMWPGAFWWGAGLRPPHCSWCILNHAGAYFGVGHLGWCASRALQHAAQEGAQCSILMASAVDLLPNETPWSHFCTWEAFCFCRKEVVPVWAFRTSGTFGLKFAGLMLSICLESHTLGKASWSMTSVESG